MRRFVQELVVVFLVGMVAVVLGSGVQAQAPVPAAPVPAGVRPATGPSDGSVTPPADYVIGSDDVLTVAFWDDQKMSADVVVRPDGKITLPLVNDIQAAGLTPEQLKTKVTEAAIRCCYSDSPSVMIRVKQINSRFVTVVGEVHQIGRLDMGASMTVLEALGAAKGLTDYAKRKDILVIRRDNGRELTFKFNYNDVIRGRNLRSNIQLKPGDTVVVP